MNLRTYKAQKLPCVVTVWDEFNPLFGKACQWVGRKEQHDMCEVIFNGVVDFVHRKYVAIGDNSEVAMND